MGLFVSTPLSELSELPWVSEVDFSLCCENWMDDARTVEQRVPEVLRWLKLNSNPNQDIVMVTHNGVLRRLLGVVDAPHCEAKLLEGFVEDFVRANGCSKGQNIEPNREITIHISR